MQIRLTTAKRLRIPLTIMVIIAMVIENISFAPRSDAVLRPAEFNAWRNCIQRSMRNGSFRLPNLRQALSEARKMGTDSPWYSVTLRQLAWEHAKAGQWDEAERYALEERSILEKIDPLFPDLPEVLIVLAECECARGNFKKALEYLDHSKRIVEKEPTGITTVADTYL